jgi:hypothetical protein
VDVVLGSSGGVLSFPAISVVEAWLSLAAWTVTERPRRTVRNMGAVVYYLYDDIT